jgi:hypothetical protein
MEQQEIISLVLGILFAISEMLGVIERGPNSVLHLAFKIWGHDVKLEIDEEDQIEQNQQAEERTFEEDLTRTQSVRPGMPALSDSLLRVYSKK